MENKVLRVSYVIRTRAPCGGKFKYDACVVVLLVQIRRPSTF